MAYRIKKPKSVESAIRRVVVEQIDKAIAELTGKVPDCHEAVHQARKRFKKIRAVLRLVRDALGETYSRENAWFRDLGRELARVRDAGVMIETLDSLHQTAESRIENCAFAAAREALVERREIPAGEGMSLEARSAEIAEKLRAARACAGRWQLSREGFEAIEPGLRKTYRRGRRAFRDAYKQLTSEAFHEWRKQVKNHWHHVRLLGHTWPRIMQARRRSLSELADLLGNSHDLTVFRQALRQTPDDFGKPSDVQVLLVLAERRQAELRAEARPLGQRVFAEKPKCLVERIRKYWHAWAGGLPQAHGRPHSEAIVCS